MRRCRERLASDRLVGRWTRLSSAADCAVSGSNPAFPLAPWSAIVAWWSRRLPGSLRPRQTLMTDPATVRAKLEALCHHCGTVSAPAPLNLATMIAQAVTIRISAPICRSRWIRRITLPGPEFPYQAGIPLPVPEFPYQALNSPSRPEFPYQAGIPLPGPEFPYQART
jgi:hypothetical protein